MRRGFAVAVLGILAGNLVIAQGVDSAKAGTKGLDPYLDGLDAMERSQWDQAAKSFTTALEQDADSAVYRTARGVANALGEKLKDAEKDLTRARQLDPRSDEARLWLAVVTAMQGNFERDSTIFPAAVNRDVLNGAARAYADYQNLARSMSHDYGQANSNKRQQSQQDAERSRSEAQDKAAREQLPPEVQRLIEQSEAADRQRETQQQANTNAGSQARLDSAKALFPELGISFARFAKTTPDLIPKLLARAQKQYEQKEYAKALRDLEIVQASRPNDPTVSFLLAGCHLHQGAPAAARVEYTRVIAAQPTNADAFFGRALAATAMNDPNRTRVDVELAAKYKPADAQKFRGDAAIVGALKRKASTPQEAIAKVNDLQNKAMAGAKWEQLVASATEIAGEVNSYRLHADEAYEDRLRALEEPTRHTPPSAANLANLGQYLYEQAITIRGEKVEPRAEFRTYRPQTKQTQDAEIAHAEAACDAALQADAKNIQAMTFKAGSQMWNLKWADAEVMLKRALAIRSDYPPLLAMFSQLLDHAAAVKSAKATGLRHVESWGGLTYTWYYYPSQAELDLADEYDAQAQKLWALAVQYLESAAVAHRGTAEGFYYEGILAKRKGDTASARAAFEQAVKLGPADAAAHDQLSAIYAALNMNREAFEQQTIATNLSHTTAGPLLAFAWGEIVRTAYQSSRDVLNRAMQFDAADPRISAYMAVICAADDKPQDALAWYQVAAALAEARLRMYATSARSGAGQVNPADVGLAMAINLRVGRLLNQLHRPAEAVDVLSLNVALQPRVARDDLYEPLATAMLPSPGSDAADIPQAENFMSLVAWSRLETGNAMLAMNRTADADAQYDIVSRLDEMVPPTVDARNTFLQPKGWATFYRCKSLLAQGKGEQAWELMNKNGWLSSLTPEQEAEHRKLQDEITQAHMQASAGDSDRQDEQYRRAYQQQLQQQSSQSRREDYERRRLRR